MDMSQWQTWVLLTWVYCLNKRFHGKRNPSPRAPWHLGPLRMCEGRGEAGTVRRQKASCTAVAQRLGG